MNSTFNRLQAIARPHVIKAANKVAFVVCTTFLRFRKPKGRHAVILGDYQSFGLLLSNERLSEFPVVLVATKRYHFAKLLPNDIRRLGAIVIVEDYADDKREGLRDRLVRYEPAAILIQAGEFIVPMCNYLNREFGLKGNPEEASQASLSKLAMREALERADVNTLDFKEVRDESGLDEIDFWPAVLKPAVSTGGLGVHLAEDASAGRAALRTAKEQARSTEFSSEQAIIAEQYVEGRQFDVEGVVSDGVPNIICIVEEYYEEFLPHFDHCWFLFNVQLPHGWRDKISTTVAASLAAAGISHGGFHCELRFDQAGNVRVLEFSNRLGGGFESTVKAATGVDLVDAYVASMLGQDFVAPPNRRRFILERYCRSTAELYEWDTYGKTKDLAVTIKHRRFRDFCGIVHATTDDWSVMSRCMTDLLGFDIDKANGQPD